MLSSGRVLLLDDAALGVSHKAYYMRISLTQVQTLPGYLRVRVLDLLSKMRCFSLVSLTVSPRRISQKILRYSICEDAQTSN